MDDLLARLPDAERERIEPLLHPAWLGPMLARLTNKRFSDPAWLFERKLDGERALAFRCGDGTRLLSRNRKDLNASYPELVEALRRQPCTDFVVDGEIVAELPLPIGGIISDRSLAAVSEQLDVVEQSANDLGCPLTSPFGLLAFMALSVIPKARVTDRGFITVR